MQKNALDVMAKCLTWRKLWLADQNFCFTSLASTALNAKEAWTKPVQIQLKLMLLSHLKNLPKNYQQAQFIAKGVIWKDFKTNLSNLVSGMTVLPLKMKKDVQGNLLRGIDKCSGLAWSVVQVHLKTLDNSFSKFFSLFQLKNIKEVTKKRCPW